MTRRGWVLAAGLAFGLAGCGDNGPPPGPPFGKPVPVSGTIKLADGTPVKGGVVTFTPVEFEAGGGKTRYECSSLIDAKGQYKAGINGNAAGLVPGQYKVSVKGRELGELAGSNVGRVPKPLTDPGTTTVTVTVEDKDTVLDVVLK